MFPHNSKNQASFVFDSELLAAGFKLTTTPSRIFLGRGWDLNVCSLSSPSWGLLACLSWSLFSICSSKPSGTVGSFAAGFFRPSAPSNIFLFSSRALNLNLSLNTTLFKGPGDFSIWCRDRKALQVRACFLAGGQKHNYWSTQCHKLWFYVYFCFMQISMTFGQLCFDLTSAQSTGQRPNFN